MANQQFEKRKYPRIPGHFVVSYRVMEKQEKMEISQTKDLSAGGMRITTDNKFEPGTELILEVRLPVSSELIKLVGTVIDSREVSKNWVYDTRIKFVAIGESRHSKIISDTINYYLKKK